MACQYVSDMDLRKAFLMSYIYIYMKRKKYMKRGRTDPAIKHYQMSPEGSVLFGPCKLVLSLGGCSCSVVCRKILY